MSKLKRAAILGIGASPPPQVMTNADLARLVNTTDEWIVSRTGITERRIVGEGELIAKYGEKAAREALAHAGLQPRDIDLVLVCTYTSDRMCPTGAATIQGMMDMGHCPAMDLNAACSGFLYGLHVANNMILAGAHRNVLLIGMEAQSRFTDYTDRSTCILFGDGAAAVVVGAVDADSHRGIYSTTLGADGKGSELITIDRCDPMEARPGGKGRQHYIRMNGREVFKFAVRMVGVALDETLRAAGMDGSQVDLLVPHQANVRIIEAAAERLGLPPEKVIVTIGRHGNTAAASIPLALYQAHSEGRLKPGTTLALVGFGGGFTWGGSIIRW